MCREATLISVRKYCFVVRPAAVVPSKRVPAASRLVYLSSPSVPGPQSCRLMVSLLIGTKDIELRVTVTDIRGNRSSHAPPCDMPPSDARQCGPRLSARRLSTACTASELLHTLPCTDPLVSLHSTPHVVQVRRGQHFHPVLPKLKPNRQSKRGTPISSFRGATILSRNAVPQADTTTTTSNAI